MRKTLIVLTAVAAVGYLAWRFVARIDRPIDAIKGSDAGAEGWSLWTFDIDVQPEYVVLKNPANLGPTTFECVRRTELSNRQTPSRYQDVAGFWLTYVRLISPMETCIVYPGVDFAETLIYHRRRPYGRAYRALPPGASYHHTAEIHIPRGLSFADITRHGH